MKSALREGKHLVFEPRDVMGTGACRKLAAAGKIPAVLYGPDFKEGTKGSIIFKEIAPILKTSRWETAMIELSLGDRKELALMRQVQLNPITRVPVHIDFMQLVRGHKIKMHVPIALLNKDKNIGAKQGGVLDIIMHDVEVSVLPKDIPEAIEIDVAHLGLGAEIKLSDIEAPEGVEWITDVNSIIVSVEAPRIKEETPEAEEAAEVQVVSKGKKKEGE